MSACPLYFSVPFTNNEVREASLVQVVRTKKKKKSNCNCGLIVLELRDQHSNSMSILYIAEVGLVIFSNCKRGN